MTNLTDRRSMAAVAGALLWALGGCSGSSGGAAGPVAPSADPGAGAEAAPAPENQLGTAADATVLAEDGSHVQLASAWKSQSAVIVFVRGHWCIYCRNQLVELEQHKAEFEALGANLVAISSDPADVEKIRAKLGITFTLYSDPDLDAIQKFGVLDPANAIARPAAFIVSSDGKIQFRYVGENASDTVTLEALLAELEKLRGDAARGSGK